LTETLHGASRLVEAASKSPLGLVALVALLVTWLLIALKVNRNQQLLKNLSQLPEKDRIKALEMEMGVVRLERGLTPEQWLKDRARTYYLIGFGVVCVTAIILIVIILNSHPLALKTGVGMALYGGPADSPAPAAQEPPPVAKERPPAAIAREPRSAPTAKEPPASVREAKVINKRDGIYSGEAIPPERKITYDAILRDGILNIGYNAAYFDQLTSGGPVSGMNYIGSPFEWRYPEIWVTVANNTAQDMVISQALVTVISSTIDPRPIPLVEDLSVNRLVIRNEGWGPIEEPVVEFTVSESLSSGQVPLFVPQLNTLKLDRIDTVQEIPIAAYVPARLHNESLVAVSGTLSYGSQAERNNLKFNTRVSQQVRAGEGIHPADCYDVRFTAGKSPLTYSLAVGREIHPRQSDNFLLSVGTDKSSNNRLRIDFLTAGGETLRGEEEQVAIFVPRSARESNACRR
jgi:hypothetical protein